MAEPPALQQADRIVCGGDATRIQALLWDQLPIGVLAAPRQCADEGFAQRDLPLLAAVASLIALIPPADAQVPPRLRPLRHAPRLPPPVSEEAPDPAGVGPEMALRTAAQRHAECQLRQAADLYLKVAREHPGTEEALVAKVKLLQIARYYDGKGALRMAADVLSRLRCVLDGGEGYRLRAPASSPDNGYWPRRPRRRRRAGWRAGA